MLVSTPAKTPIYKVAINGTELTTPLLTTVIDGKQRVDYRVEVENISNITIDLLNKEPGDTKVVDGKITEDLLIIIDRLAIDQFDLLPKLSKISIYKDTNNVVHRTHAYITFNGRMTIKIHKNVLYNNWFSSFI
jgi:hypothetical protein